MEIPEPDTWPETESEGVAIQLRLRSSVDLQDGCPEVLDTVTGLDVAYGKTTDRPAATAVTLEVIEESTVISEASFPYAPGLFAFREVPSPLAASRALKRVPDLLVCDGHGLAHPRRFGLRAIWGC